MSNENPSLLLKNYQSRLGESGREFLVLVCILKRPTCYLLLILVFGKHFRKLSALMAKAKLRV